MSSPRILIPSTIIPAAIACFAACGSQAGDPTSGQTRAAQVDYDSGTPPAEDAGTPPDTDAGTPPDTDAGEEAGVDAGEEAGEDAGEEAGEDAGGQDGGTLAW